MTDEQLIAQQARRIADLEEELSLRNEAERAELARLKAKYEGTA